MQGCYRPEKFREAKACSAVAPNIWTNRLLIREVGNSRNEGRGQKDGGGVSTHRLRDFDWQEPFGVLLASSAWGHDGARPRISVGGLKDRIAEPGVVVPHQSRPLLISYFKRGRCCGRSHLFPSLRNLLTAVLISRHI